MSECRVFIREEKDINMALRYTLQTTTRLAFSEMETQKVLVCVSELTRNILDHTNSIGWFMCEAIYQKGIRIVIEDCGDGITEIEKVLCGKEYISKGLGLGLLGSKNLMDEFKIETSKGGTRIAAIKWRAGRTRAICK